ncbi:unnamed protein product [Amoebophrya sp. A25]|nr:unnamed protein product [Amoebophrya sp. A25]|eukprot:GSA25T00017814001.1
MGDDTAPSGGGSKSSGAGGPPVTRTATSATGGTAAKNPGSSTPPAAVEGSLTPFYCVVLCGAALVTQWTMAQVDSMRQAEVNWDPSPKNMVDNQVLIMYCNG